MGDDKPMSTIKAGRTNSTRLSIESDNTHTIFFKSSESNLLNIVNETVSIMGQGFILPTGNTAQRPANPIIGEIRFNTTTNTIEGYSGTNWVNISQ